MADYRPLWQDLNMGVQNGYFYVYKGGDSQNGTLVYSGHARLSPGASGGPAPRAYVRLNDILYSNMDRVALPDFGSLNSFEEVNFTTYFTAYDSGTFRFGQNIINDWSYDYEYNYETQYKDICKKYKCKAKVFTKMKTDLKNKIGNPDLMILFTNTCSHKMVNCALCEAKRCCAVVERCHSSSLTALQNILETHCSRPA